MVSDYSWQLVENFKSCERFNKFWHIVSSKIRLHLQAKAKQIRDKSVLQPASNRAENVMPRHGATMLEDGMLSENEFTVFKRLYLYGTLNLEMFPILYPSIKEILNGVKDFEHSFEIKLAVHYMLVICKDKQGDKHKEVLKSLTGLLRYLYEYISLIDVKYGNQKPPQVANNASGQSSSRRQIDGELSAWEQERLTKIK